MLGRNESEPSIFAVLVGCLRSSLTCTNHTAIPCISPRYPIVENCINFCVLAGQRDGRSSDGIAWG